jgi:hypothetical protein
MKPTILTLAIGTDYRRRLAACLESKRSYATKHGYTYIEGGEQFWDRTRPIPWSKTAFVLANLQATPDGTLFWLSDSDVLITNPDIRVEDLFHELLPGDKDLLITIDACGHLNSGNLLMRNSPWLREFWGRVDQQRDLTHHIWWENAAIIRLLEMNPADLAKTQVTTEHKRINAYLQGLPGQPLWAPGDFLIHFAGIYDLETMEALAQKIISSSSKENRDPQ